MTWPIDPVWEALAKRCEECEYMDRELDCDIALALLGGEILWKMANYTMDSYPVRRYPSSDFVGGFGNAAVERYTCDMNAAYQTIPGFATEQVWSFYVSNRGYKDGVYLDGKSYARVDHPMSSGGGPYFDGASKYSIAASICAAGLRAHGNIKAAFTAYDQSKKESSV